MDVREPSEFSRESLEDTVNMPLSRLEKEAGGLDRGMTLYLICQTGNRARQAAGRLKRLGFERVHVVEGGLEGCKQQGAVCAITHGGVWAMDRQVRFAAGALVLAGMALAWLLHPWFLALSFFVAAGLVYSAVTDTCGMAMVLAKMPWNKA